MEKFATFARIAEVEFSDVVLSTQYLGHKFRIYLKDKTFIDFFYTTRLKNKRFSIHWERVYVDGYIYRIDNTPDKKWSKVATFPLHFHNKEYDKVENAELFVNKGSLEEIFRKFLGFVRKKIG